MKKSLVILVGVLCMLAGCRQKLDKSAGTNQEERLDGLTEAIEDSVKKANALMLQSRINRVVHAKGQTVPVDQLAGVDAADDPAIWYNEVKPEESRILGTDKLAGLGLYNLDGDLIDFSPIGRVNNVDLRYDFPLDGKKITIAAASERNRNAIVLFKVTADSLQIIHNEPVVLDTSIIDDAYGCCMYYSRKKEAYYVFVGGKKGYVQQWRLFEKNGKVHLLPVRNLKVPSQAEGMVADDETGMLYIAEESRAIWRIGAEEDQVNHKTIVARSDSLNPNITYDLEGLDIYYAGNGKGYLIASVQGNFSYAVFEKDGTNRYLGNFIIKDSGGVDGVEETDGLAITNMGLGSKYPNGLLVVQDGFNTDNGKDLSQNFKLVDWSEVTAIYKDSLLIAPDFKWWRQ